jgi:uncharacterized protein
VKFTYFRDRLRSIMQLDDPPQRLALAFGLGVFIAFSPTIGLHFLTCLLIAVIFRLSKLVIITASLVMNPWTMIPLYGFCLWFGLLITGADIEPPQIAWNELGLMDLFTVVKPYLWPFVAGTLVVGAVGGILSYFGFYWLVVRYRRTEPDRSA